MSTPTEQRTSKEVPARRFWTIAVAAVAALVLAIAGGVTFLGDGGEDPAVADAPPLELTAGGEDIAQMCIAFSPEELEKVAEIAFEGTVTSVEGDTITLSVDTWFRGGESTEVVLNAPQGMEALIGGIPFESGDQYLISAQDGSVNYCGFSGESTDELRQGFEEAFTQG